MGINNNTILLFGFFFAKYSELQENHTLTDENKIFFALISQNKYLLNSPSTCPHVTLVTLAIN